jgi:hypothetical protein
VSLKVVQRCFENRIVTASGLLFPEGDKLLDLLEGLAHGLEGTNIIIFFVKILGLRHSFKDPGQVSHVLRLMSLML